MFSDISTPAWHDELDLMTERLTADYFVLLSTLSNYKRLAPFKAWWKAVPKYVLRRFCEVGSVRTVLHHV